MTAVKTPCTCLSYLADELSWTHSCLVKKNKLCFFEQLFVFWDYKDLKTSSCPHKSWILKADATKHAEWCTRKNLVRGQQIMWPVTPCVYLINNMYPLLQVLLLSPLFCPWGRVTEAAQDRRQIRLFWSSTFASNHQRRKLKNHTVARHPRRLLVQWAAGEPKRDRKAPEGNTGGSSQLFKGSCYEKLRVVKLQQWKPDLISTRPSPSRTLWNKPVTRYWGHTGLLFVVRQCL